MTNNVNLTIWNRELKLEITYDCYEGEEVLQSQENALKMILSKWAVVDNSLDEVIRYCLNNNGLEIDGESIDNIFRYVMPEALFIKRRTGKRVVALMCNYRFDIEHGLAIVFENEKLACIGPQDIVL